MISSPSTSLFEMARCLSNAADLVSPLVAGHQKRVAFIAASLARELGLDSRSREEVLLAGLLHDIGALSLNERLQCLSFEEGHARQHAEAGFQLMSQVDCLAMTAKLVRYHHLPWEEGRGRECEGEHVPAACHLLHLADRIEVLIDRKREILSQVPEIMAIISDAGARRFIPEHLEAFRSLAVREHFWFELGASLIDSALEREHQLTHLHLDMAGLAELARVFAHTIDFRCRFTSVHSSGVAVVARQLGELMGASQLECRHLEVAGQLHDFGKLALPAEILEQPFALSAVQYNQVKAHPFLAFRLLEPVTGLGSITTWVSLHHERPDGKGYPFRIAGQDLPLGSRILSVADVFTALTEDRPYRPGLPLPQVTATLLEMVDEGALDGDIVALLAREAESVDGLRCLNQEREGAAYREFTARIGEGTALA